MDNHSHLSHSLRLHVCQIDLHSRTKQTPHSRRLPVVIVCVYVGGLANARIWHHRTFKRLKFCSKLAEASFEQTGSTSEEAPVAFY